MYKKPEFTPNTAKGGFYYRFFNKSPLGDLGVKIFHACLPLILMVSVSSGKGFSQTMETINRFVKIGLLIQDDRSIAAVHGAELAVGKANKKGGLNGLDFQLVVRSMEGPWGTGSKQAVDLIFEEKVWALLGSHDGRNAHLVEQAATKSQVVFLSAWTSDPTLSQAFVPWFFNCVPNDRQQAGALIEEICNRRSFDKIAVVTGEDYDSRMALSSFLKEIKMAGRNDADKFYYINYNRDISDLPDQISNGNATCIILFCQPEASVRIVHEMGKRGMKQSLYGSLFLLNENEVSEQELQVYDNILSVACGNWPESKNAAFRQEFHKAYGRLPGMAASYAFDGCNLLIEAIRNAGSSDREKIQKALAAINYEGVTGTIGFDGMGNRSGSTVIIQVRNGIPSAPLK